MKRIVLAAVLIVATFGLVACGGGSDNSAADISTAAVSAAEVAAVAKLMRRENNPWHLKHEATPGSPPHRRERK